MPQISVIVPAYKVEEYLPRCVDSILAQTFTDFELWLVDDGSPDRCGEICEEYAKRDSRIHVIHKKNGGLSDARNAALEVATGEYISFVDSDDWIAPDMLETMHQALVFNQAQIAIGNMVSVHENGQKENMYCPSQCEKVIEGNAILETMHQPCAPNRLYVASLFRSIRYPVGRLYEDVFVYHHILKQVQRMVYTGKESYYYFLRMGSIMRMPYNMRNMDIIDAIDDRVQTLDNMGKKEKADEECLFIYSQVAAAQAYANRKDPEAMQRLQHVVQVFHSYYPRMMGLPIIFRQKVRIFLLRYFPTLHTAVWGRKMPINLGG